MEEEKPRRKTIHERRRDKRIAEYGNKKRTYKQKTKIVYNTRGKIQTYNSVPPKEDYLKYIRIVRYWACKYYNVTLPNLEILLFLYSEGLFTENYFTDFTKLCGFKMDRFTTLRKDGWVVIFRDQTPNELAIYEVSKKTKSMIRTIYRKLNGIEPISEHSSNNPIFLATASHTDKNYQRSIIEMNKKNAKERFPGFFKKEVNDTKYYYSGITRSEFIESRRNPSPE